ncbi:MAG: pyruvate ferredoxin oxidoreductase [Planctomycetota bacterium]
MTIELISANHAAAIAAALAGNANRTARGFGGGVYPITPQSECIELLSRLEIQKGQIVRVESEHSAMAVCMGFSLGGARAFTASSSNGLSYMTENVFAAAFYRLPIVMMAVNRTLGPPWNIWVDHGDTLALRDSGWVQFYCEDNQEVADSVLCGYRLGEDRRVLLPVLVCQDAFVLSHTMMATDIPEQELVDRFLPPLDLPHRMTAKACTIGGLDFPHETEVHRKQFMDAMAAVPDVYAECQDEFARVFGRRPGDAVIPYRTADADCVVISMGTTHATVRTAVDEARAQGIKVGALRVRMFRPFPEPDLRHHLSGKRRVAVIDRDLCPGLGGILWAEVRACVPPPGICQNYLLGLGGGDIRPEHIAQIIDDLLSRDQEGTPLFKEVG